MDGAGEPMTQRLATAAGVPRATGTDPRGDLVRGSITLHRGRIEFEHPRDAMEVLLDQDFEEDEQYPPYWAELWPSGIELAYAVSERELTGRSVLELGCGLGLPSIAAALAGGRVLATDRSPDAIALTRANARLSGAELETDVRAWTPGTALAERGPWDLVLGADVVYNQRNVDELLVELPRLVDDTGEVWLADPGRPYAHGFLEAAREAWETVQLRDTRIPDVTIVVLRGPVRRAPRRSGCEPPGDRDVYDLHPSWIRARPPGPHRRSPQSARQRQICRLRAGCDDHGAARLSRRRRPTRRRRSGASGRPPPSTPP